MMRPLETLTNTHLLATFPTLIFSVTVSVLGMFLNVGFVP